MDRTAVFVDVGYLYAQGSTALYGSIQPRSTLILDRQKILEELKKFASTKAPQPILRIYWYDGARYSGPTPEHNSYAFSEDVKVRLGLLNSAGEQKGVDSMIVTDMVELARNRAMCDAVLLSGDEDVRIGVSIAQSYGVRVHLLGIFPSRGSQSSHLQHEADTASEWSKDTVETFLSRRAAAASEPTQPETFLEPAPLLEPARQSSDAQTESEGLLLGVVSETLELTRDQDVVALASFIRENRGIPPEYDRPMLGKSREKLGRDLTESEKKFIRVRFRESILNK